MSLTTFSWFLSFPHWFVEIVCILNINHAINCQIHTHTHKYIWKYVWMICISSVQFSRSFVSNSLQPHGLRKVMTNLDSILKSRDITLPKEGPSSQGYGFSGGHVWMWELDYKESWVLKNWCFWTVVLGKILESPLDCKEIQAVHPKGNQSWVFTGRTDVEAETPMLWPT